MTTSDDDTRYSVYRSLRSKWLFVQPQNDVPRPDTIKLRLGFVTTFSQRGAVAFASQCAKLLNCRIAYINMPAETSK